MSKAYWVSHSDVSDPDRFLQYAKAAVTAFDAFGARMIVRGGRTAQVEGTGRSRTVIVEFDSMEAAVACYESEAYQQARALREGAAELDIVILEGLA